MTKVKIKLNSAGVRRLLKSKDFVQILLDYKAGKNS